MVHSPELGAEVVAGSGPVLELNRQVEGVVRLLSEALRQVCALSPGELMKLTEEQFESLMRGVPIDPYEIETLKGISR
ncbi:hypothetical protein FNQ90_02465 [Streptomyces alkaliphilus]|uniref:Uncharacterized protein n=1 Tax=Streptomyces alkaliphilus TaxID=1472722 RepID=A0A7W3TA10_9ACTN|nr:hypothetical protein [Streptomyces alkaliphilus]MBB0242999.1 hypothetical protein [Streptomyces alkaliphilus]